MPPRHAEPVWRLVIFRALGAVLVSQKGVHASLNRIGIWKLRDSVRKDFTLCHECWDTLRTDTDSVVGNQDFFFACL